MVILDPNVKLVCDKFSNFVIELLLETAMNATCAECDCIVICCTVDVVVTENILFAGFSVVVIERILFGT